MGAAYRIEDLGQYRPNLVRFARARLFNPAHAEDAVQETLLAAIESIDRCSGTSSLLTWLTGILKHKIVDCVRRSTRDQWQAMDNDGTPLEARDDDRESRDRPADTVLGLCGPEAALIRQRLLEALDQCVLELPERTAKTFVLRELIGLNTAETCRVLEVSETYCAVMLHRARARIRAQLAPDWMAA
ncbi:MAG: sigma-70 family RNA polymerase sigma factor [Betaproteobacteria bacterium]